MPNFFSKFFGKKETPVEPTIDNLNGLFNQSIDEVDDRHLTEEVYFHLDYLLKDEDDEMAIALNWPEQYQHVYYINYLIGEVNNGGFNQYYYNFSGNYAPYTAQAFKAIGAEKHYELMLNANAVFEAENDKITAEQDGTLEGFSRSYDDNPLEEYDRKIYELEEIEDIYKLQADYIRAHREIFADM